MKKHYVPPHLIQYDLENAPAHVRRAAKELRAKSLSQHSGHQVSPQYITVVDNEHNYVQVSESFCELLGYAANELIGQKYDYVTASNTTDIPTAFNALTQLGYNQGLWVLVHRTGTHILVRYEAWVRPDSYIESNLEVVHQFHQADPSQ